jgi:hypothetical protein
MILALPSGSNDTERLVKRFTEYKIIAHLIRQKSFFPHVFDQPAQRRPVVVDVGENDRLRMEADLPPRNRLEGLVQASDATRENQNRIGAVHHLTFTFVHTFDEYELIHARGGRLDFSQKSGRYSDCTYSEFGRRSAHHTHQSDCRSAEYDVDAGLGTMRGNLSGRIGIRGPATNGRTTEYSDSR